MRLHLVLEIFLRKMKTSYVVTYVETVDWNARSLWADAASSWAPASSGWGDRRTALSQTRGPSTDSQRRGVGAFAE